MESGWTTCSLFACEAAVVWVNSDIYPTRTTRLGSVVLRLTHRRRRWVNLKTTLPKRLVFTVIGSAGREQGEGGAARVSIEFGVEIGSGWWLSLESGPGIDCLSNGIRHRGH